MLKDSSCINILLARLIPSRERGSDQYPVIQPSDLISSPIDHSGNTSHSDDGTIFHFLLDLHSKNRLVLSPLLFKFVCEVIII